MDLCSVCLKQGQHSAVKAAHGTGFFAVWLQKSVFIPSLENTSCITGSVETSSTAESNVEVILQGPPVVLVINVTHAQTVDTRPFFHALSGEKEAPGYEATCC